MAKRLLRIFGPLILAAILVFAVLASPVTFGFKHISAARERQAAVSLSPNVLRGKHIKEAALSNGYVPFFGSSEWSRIDPMHPSVLAQKYHRDYRPFLLGARGTQSLTQFFVMQNIQSELRNKKAVVFVSPQWFVKGGTRKDAFGFYYSQLQTTEWLTHYRHDAIDQYAAKRLLQMPAAKSDHFIYAALQRVAAGKSLTDYQRFYLQTRKNMLTQEDQFFSGINLPSQNLSRVNRQAKKLPTHYSYSALDRLGGQLGKQATGNNRFQISDKFYNQGLKQEIKSGSLKGFQKNLSYLKSPEYSDFQLILDQFARLNTNVIFIIPPINQRWQKYTGLSATMLKQFDQKIHYQLQSQGFNNIVDLSDKGNVPYFMTDTIHPGWRGWLAIDRRVDPFLTKKQAQPHYKINDKFYDKQWQQLGPNQLQQYENETK
ncbi:MULTISPECIES: D-alanyl-lipoteichoic acid biosynthesis protein DltD [Lactobacillaceae]|uniref:D-alanyl-lipoteichoic acid biosynthesis protein DltD n=1 Tax=Lactobacillaceae TaxID=33958 RepID=UPI0014571236|nr:D-alanyl-lipoteichoic acid biosynthesis protein DltD [Lactobacillus sp. HBUAS51381]NLR08618.1 D-alanyl-lipoteichoic acid biosynthesis protein DltD [Lactobacillus sp. HBUAS51381]